MTDFTIVPDIEQEAAAAEAEVITTTETSGLMMKPTGKSSFLLPFDELDSFTQ